ncbi:head GIN domain-containing protein [Sphingobium aquiterrae]|uniref:head GIN domain-containing protein n=1 Tax=Sphingobium aquiterrae TaxID=2038656 RepID=UPI0030190455
MAVPAFLSSRAALAGLALLAGACSPDRGDAIGPASATDYAALRDFTRVEAVGPDHVVITVGKPFAVKAQGDARALATLEIRVKDGSLVVGRKDGWRSWWGHGDDGKGVTVHVSMPAIAGATLTGSGDLDIDSARTESLSLGLAGSGDMRIGTISAQRLKAEIGGSGTLALSGTANDADIAIAGSGDVNAPGLKLGKGSVSIAGSGSATFASDGPVSVDLVGSGDVTVKGKAQCRVNAIGSGEAHCGA